MPPARGSSRNPRSTGLVTPAVRKERAGAQPVKPAVVAGTDFTPGSETALARAATLARATGSTLVVVHVVSGAAVHPEVTVSGGWTKMTRPAETEDGARALNARAGKTDD